jgi:aryl-alcohol dehydrogenase
VPGNERGFPVDITAAVLREKGGAFSIEQLSMDDPRPTEIVVELAGTGVCATDLSFRDGKWPFPHPGVLGHEGAGTVVAIGNAVTDLAVGDRVVLSLASCGRCRACLSGMPTQCPNATSINISGCRPDGTTTLTDAAGAHVHGNFVGQSSFASHALTEARFAVKVPDDLPLALLGTLGCGVQAGAGSVLNVLKPTPGSTVAVFGLGAVGLSAIAAAVMSGCSRVVGVDVQPGRFPLATQFGATDLVDAGTADVVAALRELSDGGADGAVEASGSPVALRTAFDSTHKSGTTVLVGAAPVGTEYKIGSTALMAGRVLRGCTMGQANPRVFIPDLVAMYRRGLLPLEAISQTYRLADIDRALQDAQSGAVVKAVLVAHDDSR